VEAKFAKISPAIAKVFISLLCDNLLTQQSGDQVEQQGLPNKFKGKNFVFDERLGERISNEVISTCHLCKKTKSDTHYHCKNQICHTLFIGCDECIEKRNGYCSWGCAQVDKLPQRVKKMTARYYNLYIRKRRPFQKTGLRAE